MPTNKEIAAYARREAKRVMSVRRVDPDHAAELEAAARAECERMYAEQRAAR
jgi:hypothetical protein